MATGILTANALDPRLTLQSHSATLGLTCNLVPQPPCAPPPQVDGGVSAANIAEIAEAGADMFVAGSAIFNSAPSSPRSLPRRALLCCQWASAARALTPRVANPLGGGLRGGSLGHWRVRVRRSRRLSRVGDDVDRERVWNQGVL